MIDTTRRRPWVGCAALVGALLFAESAAAAPQVAISKPCYRAGDSIALTGTGFTPGGPVTVSIAYAEQTATFSLVSDASGNLGVNLTAPVVEGRPEAVLTATDETLATQGAAPAETTATAPAFQLTSWRTLVRFNSVKPVVRGRVVAFGWAHVEGTQLYAHFVRRGKRIATQSIGHLAGPCGDLEADLRLRRRLPPGSYRVYFDASPRWPNQVQGAIFRLPASND